MLKLGYDSQVSFSEAISLLPEQLHAVGFACFRAKCMQAFESPRRNHRGWGLRVHLCCFYTPLLMSHSPSPLISPSCPALTGRWAAI